MDASWLLDFAFEQSDVAFYQRGGSGPPHLGLSE
jgi:hypothetical protein